MKISREVKTGVISILIIILFIWGYSFLKNQSLMSKSRKFYAEYTTVEGLATNSPLTINGLKVGKISNITFNPNKEGVLVVEMEMTDDYQFSKNSIAQIYSPDFISGKSLRIKVVFDGAEVAQSGDTLKGEISSGIIGMINEQIAPLQLKVEQFIVNSDSVMQHLNAVLDQKNRENISQSLASLNRTLKNFNSISEKADNLIAQNQGKMDSILSNAHNSMQQLSDMTTGLNEAGLDKTVEKLQTTLDEFNKVLDSINNGSGSMSLLLNDEGLYRNLEGASKELELLLKDMKEHPKRFVHFSVFGKKEKPYEEEPVVENPEK